MSPHDAFAFAAVRDLLGIVRALWTAAERAGASERELARIRAVGRDLQQALKLATAARGEGGTYDLAWARAEEATARAGELIDAFTPAEPMVTAARTRVAGARAALDTRKRKPAPR